MPEVTVTAETYPDPGVVGFQVEQYSYGDWRSALDTPVVGTFPDYTVAYSVPVSAYGNPLRARWETAPGVYTEWFTPLAAQTPTAEQTDRLKSAVIQKATRLLVMAEAPLGTWGELTEFGQAAVRPDYAIQELLFGLSYPDLIVDLTTLVDTDDVIRVGLQATPADFPADRLPDIERAIASACDWITGYLSGVGVA